MFVRISMLFVLLAMHADVFAATEAQASSASSLQLVGAQMKRALDRDSQGSPPSMIELSRFDNQMADIRRSIDDSDTSNLHKLRAVDRLLGMLKSNATHSSSARIEVSDAGRTTIDEEILSAQHGARCDNALGIGESDTVRLVLAKSASAWFVVSHSDAKSLRLTTQSTGPDPMLDIFTRCASNASPTASNDDNFGLDASVTTAVSGKPVYVRLTNTGETGAISLALAAVESITGVVRSATTNQPILGVEIDAYTSDNRFFGSIDTDQNGAYTLTPSQPGTYFIIANTSYYLGYLSQIYPTGYCAFYFSADASDCDQSHAKAITVGSSGTISNINFSLRQGAQLSGQVRDSTGIPLTGTVSLSSTGSTFQLSATTDNVGHYAFKNLPPGSYQVEATAYGYGSEYFDHVACAGALQNQCDGISGTPIEVGLLNIADIDFNLPHLSSITGKTTTINGVTPVPAEVDVYDTSGSFVTIGASYDGTYTAGPLPNGTYYVVAGGNGYFPQLYSGHDCIVNCLSELNYGTPITLSFAGQTATADFALQPLSTLRGHVVDSISGLPLPNVQIVLNTQPPAGQGYPNYSTYTDAGGNYSLSSMPLGRYYVWAVSSDHIDEIYAGIPCEDRGGSSYLIADCDVSGATLVSIAPNLTPADVDFALAPSAVISGRITVRGAGDTPAYSVAVTIVDGTGSAVQSVFSDANGNYAASDLTAGTYYAIASAGNYNTGTYVSQIWESMDCTTQCAATTGTPIAVAAQSTASGVDFSLLRQDAIVGRVTDTDGSPVSNVVIDAFNTTDKSYFGGAATDADGFYVLPVTIGATYFVATEATGGYTNQIYSEISCATGSAYDGNCSLTGATSVSVGNGATQSHVVDFSLTINDRVFRNGFD